jgi:hypothetical protein
MDKVFITHSRHDAPILAHIEQLVKEAKIDPIFYGYDFNNTAETASQQILNAIKGCKALFIVLSNNLSSSPHTQNWVGMEVGIARALNKPVYVFEQLHSSVLFPIPYLTDYVPYDLDNPELRTLISSVARAYNMNPQLGAIAGLGGLGALIFGPLGLVGGAILGAMIGSPQQPPYASLVCYHLDCKLRFRSYVWLDTMNCPSCRRILRFQQQHLEDGNIAVIPNPYKDELQYTHYVWFNPKGTLQLYKPNQTRNFLI